MMPETPARLQGEWKGFAERTLTIHATVRSRTRVKNVKATRTRVAEYELSPLPLLPPAMQQGMVALFRVRKLLPEEESYTVGFYGDGRRPTCDCKWASWRHDDNPETCCVHVSVLLTMKKLTAGIPDHVPAKTPPPSGSAPCPLCGGVGEIPYPDGSGGVELRPCPECQTSLPEEVP